MKDNCLDLMEWVSVDLNDLKQLEELAGDLATKAKQKNTETIFVLKTKSETTIVFITGGLAEIIMSIPICNTELLKNYIETKGFSEVYTEIPEDVNFRLASSPEATLRDLVSLKKVVDIKETKTRFINAVKFLFSALEGEDKDYIKKYILSMLLDRIPRMDGEYFQKVIFKVTGEEFGKIINDIIDFPHLIQSQRRGPEELKNEAANLRKEAVRLQKKADYFEHLSNQPPVDMDQLVKQIEELFTKE